MRELVTRLLARWVPLLSFRSSQNYWRERYRRGGDSGSGSAGEAARYKAEVLNAFVRIHHISSIIEFGCGDGRQLQHAAYPQYLGVDISAEAVEACRSMFGGESGKRFILLDDYRTEKADLSMSLDVLFHLVEDSVYEEYLGRLFAASDQFVAIYSTDTDVVKGTLPHVRHRAVSADIKARFPDFTRMEAEETSLPQPVEFNRGEPTRFLFYRRLQV